MAGTDSERLLPLVHENTGFAVQEEVASNPNFLEEQLRRLSDNDVNPRIINFLSQFGMSIVSESGSREALNAALHAGLIVYRLLESQAAADKLSATVE